MDRATRSAAVLGAEDGDRSPPASQRGKASSSAQSLPAPDDGPSHLRKPSPKAGAPKTPGVQMEGWLLKWTNYVLGHQERYFVLKGNVLAYYRDKAEMQHTCRGTIILSGARITSMDELNFSIATTTQIIYLKAYDELGAKRWITALEMAKGINAGFQTIRREFTEDDEESEDEWNDEDEIDEEDFLPGLKEKLQKMKTQRDVVLRETTVMQSAFTHIDSQLLDRSPKLKLLHKHGAQLYTLVTGELLKACEEFLDQASQATARLERRIKAEERKREKLEQTVSQLARQHRRLETQASHLRAIMPEDTEGLGIEVESDDEFYDAENETWEEAYDHKEEYKELVDVSIVTRETVTTVGGTDQWRPRIPYRRNVPLNIWGILKNFIGKDLSKIPMPVVLNEPLSMLQRLTEDLEYSQLLDKAAKCSSSQERMCYIAAFTMSSYASTYYRTYKPFNPLLGETFELDLTDDPNYGWRTVAEQVSHHPPIASMYTESEHWEMLQQFSMVSKFRGKYLSIVPTGTSWVRFKATGEKISWTKVTTVVNNIIIGKLWIDQYGDMQLINHTTGDVCNMKYVPYSYFSSEPQRTVKGNVVDRNGREHYVIRGTWDRYMVYHAPNRPNDEVATWHVGTLPPDNEKMYGFSYFGCMLNDPRNIVGTAPTDCRRRPDLRALEDTDVDLAEAEKLRLEEKQRAARKMREEERETYFPMWFEATIDPETERPIHVFKGDYWDRKAKQDWSGCVDIY